MIEQIQGKPVLIIGDIMLDQTTTVRDIRKSPEAPALCVNLGNAENVRYSLGGAANVARNIVSLGGQALLYGFVGEDETGGIVKRLLYQEGIRFYPLSVPDRPTTVKHRIVCDGQQVIRLDTEIQEPIEEWRSDIFTDALSYSHEAVIFSDYDKGVITPSMIRTFDHYPVPVIADPKRRNIWEYKGIHTLKPNEPELLGAFGQTDPLRQWNEAAKWLQTSLGCQAVFVTRGGDNAALIMGDEIHDVPVYPVEVRDVTGAGDTVAAAYALGLAGGATEIDAAYFAMLAAHVAVTHQGCYAVSAADLLDMEEGSIWPFQTLHSLP